MTTLKEQVGKGFDVFRALRPGEATLKTATEAQSLPIGEVALVKSISVTELGAHFIVITGPRVMKEHGLRPQTFTIPAKDDEILKTVNRPLVLFHLNKQAKEEFYNFYGLELSNNSVNLKTMDDEL